MHGLKSSLVALALGAGLIVSGAHAAPLVGGQNPAAGVEGADLLQKAQVFWWKGHRYCFYWDGWRGPGWYRCGFHWRRGYGWGGSPGWRGWAHPPRPPHFKGGPPPKGKWGPGPKGGPGPKFGPGPKWGPGPKGGKGPKGL